MEKRKASEKKTQHPDHTREINRLNRIAGQLEGVRKMILDNRYCPDVLIQTRAITSAIRSLESSILEKHLRHCVHSAFKSKKSSEIEEKIAELLDLFQKRLPS